MSSKQGRKARIIERNDGSCEVQLLYAFWNTGSWETEANFSSLEKAKEWIDAYQKGQLPNQVKSVWMQH